MSQDVKIRVSPETRTALKDIGLKGESYDTIIRLLIWSHNEAYDMGGPDFGKLVIKWRKEVEG